MNNIKEHKVKQMYDYFEISDADSVFYNSAPCHLNDMGTLANSTPPHKKNAPKSSERFQYAILSYIMRSLCRGIP